MMNKLPAWPFDMDLSTLDTGSITNILTDIENHLPHIESTVGMNELLRVKTLFENELKSAHRLH
ncbi:MAG: hypothetical protein H7A05_10395 [Pseudomonadales bacterium]|nr:hypothetical protein [Pseudomonadales bacterium]MCP5345022.1 hypothetical protein [Pseudomonadales bacterium]MCP5357893.1 hypothetical protein [Pseudomonadales bacterium]